VLLDRRVDQSDPSQFSGNDLELLARLAIGQV
jgi:hypothetical protein